MNQHQPLRNNSTQTHRSPVPSSLFPPLSRLWLALAVGLCGLLPAQAQTYPRARLEVLTPPGAQAGASTEVEIKGTDLVDVTSLYLSDARLKAEVVPPPPPKLDPKTKKPLPNQPVPPLKFKIIVPADMPVGTYDVRAVGLYGISNPRAFTVGDLKEVMEKEPNNDVKEAQKVELNTTINGIITAPTDVDYYAFTAKKGERVIVHCAASEIDSKLNPLIEVYTPKGRLLESNRNYLDQNAVADCLIPEDGEYLVRLCQFAYIGGGNDHFYRLSVTTKPWIDAVFPAVVEPGKPATVTLFGRNLPGGQADSGARLNGRPLEKVSVQIQPPMGGQKEPGLEFSGTLLPRAGTLSGFEYRLKGPAGLSNPVLITYARAPVILQNDKNHDSDQAQAVAAPCTICGKLNRTGDRDWYAFTAKKGDSFTLEGVADRVGAPLHLDLRVHRQDKVYVPVVVPSSSPFPFPPLVTLQLNKLTALANLDKSQEVLDTLNQFSIFNQDPKGKFAAPQDGTYLVEVSSYTALPGGGPRMVYRLNIHKEEPSFRLIVVANANLNGGAFVLAKGGYQPLHFVVVREDGFDGEVTLEAEGLPKGVSCAPQVVGHRLKEATLVLQAAADAPEEAGAITIKGTAMINGQKVVRTAQAGTLVWPVPNGIPAISRLARSTCLAVREKATFTLDTDVKELSAPLNGQVAIKVKANRLAPTFKEQIQLVRVAALTDAAGRFLNLPQVNIPNNKGDAEVKFQIPANTPPGNYTIVFEGKAKFNYTDPKDAKKKKNVDVHECTPPIKLLVYDKVADLSVASPKMTVKAGEQVDVVVKVQRLNNYKDAFDVQVVVPGGFGGVTVAPAKIAAGADEVKVTLKTAKNATVATNPNFVVKATAKVGNVTLNHETKFELTVTKATAANDRPVAQPESALVRLEPARTAVAVRLLAALRQD
jgi:hypothetical protein